MKDAYVLKCRKSLLILVAFLVIVLCCMGGLLLYVAICGFLEYHNKPEGMPFIIFSLILGIGFLALAVYSPIEIMKKTNKMRRCLVIDKNGIKSADFTVAWSDVKECLIWRRDNGRSIQRERILVIMTNDGGEYDENLGLYSYDKQELREMINLYAGCQKFNDDASSIEDAHAKVSIWLYVIAIALIAPPFTLLEIYGREGRLSTNEYVVGLIAVIIWAIIVGLCCYKYKKHWRRKNNYYYD